MQHREIVVYHRDDGQWDYNVVAPNGEIVEGSLQGYTERNDCAEAAAREHPGLAIRYEDD